MRGCGAIVFDPSIVDLYARFNITQLGYNMTVNKAPLWLFTGLTNEQWNVYEKIRLPVQGKEIISCHYDCKNCKAFEYVKQKEL